MIAAPIAAYLVEIMPARVLGVAAGGLIVLTNCRTILESLGATGSTVAVAAAFLLVLWVSGITWAVKQERRTRALERQGVEVPAVPVV